MTKKIILLSLVFGTSLWATSPEVHHLDRLRDSHVTKVQHPIHKKQHHSMEKEMKHAKAMRRTFKTAKEYRHAKRRHHKMRKHMKYMKSIVRGRDYRDDRYTHRDYERYGDSRRYDNYRARGHRHYKDSWYLAFRYDRASFYDNEGFYYGYFNRSGYTFEGEFYRYDRYYTYHDRVHGKGLFSHRYFRPIEEYYSYNDYGDGYRGW